MSRRVAIVQSSYIPWKGYFDLIASVDEFILYDDVQYTRRDWRNRNRIKTPRGPRWLTVPVRSRGRYHQRIADTEISDPGWPARHWDVLAQSYRPAPHFERYEDRLRALYLGTEERLLHRVNELFLRALCDMLGIRTHLSRSDGLATESEKTERLAALCRRAGATHYVSGPAAKAYLKERVFSEAGIAVEYFDYGGYPEYPQLYPPFEHRVSILDLLLNTGPEAARFMKALGEQRLVRS